MSSALYITARGFLKARQQLCRAIYRDDEDYRDSLTPLVELVIHPRGVFAQGATVLPWLVKSDDGRPLVSCVFIIATRMPQTLQVAFFEALPDQPVAVACLIAEARRLARERHCPQIVVSLCGHVNNGLGILADRAPGSPCFGSPYNPPYYVDYLQPFASREETLVAFNTRVDRFIHAQDPRLTARLGRRFKVRPARFAQLRPEIELYTELNNRAFAHHPLYFERTVDEDYELFKSFGPFLREENFLIAEHDGKPVGFLLWYPDLNELVPRGGGVPLTTLIQYRLLRRPIARFRLAEFGVLEEYQGTGVVVALMNACAARVAGKHTVGESGWIVESNRKSLDMARFWAGEPCKKYKVYEVDPHADEPA